MIDFVKAKCNYIRADEWKNNEKLSFVAAVELRTGEILDVPLVANYNGLKFLLTPAKKLPGHYYCEIEGSLHKFFNGGLHNLNDFSITDIHQTLITLKDEFGIIPEQTTIHNLEFGLNILIDIPADQFLKGIICMPNKEFTVLDIKKLKIGKVCQRSEYSIKLYDKGLQSNQPVDNLLRVEVKVKKMRYLAKAGITTLSSICDPSSLEQLGKILTDHFKEIIFYDGSIPPARLTPRQRIKLAQFTNPKVWLELDKDSKYKLKKDMAILYNQFGVNQVKNNALSALLLKWSELNFWKRKNSDVFTGVFGENEAEKIATFSPLECHVNTSLIIEENIGGATPSKNALKILPNSPISDPSEQRSLCLTCNRDISRQRKGSKFCSETLYGKAGKRCRNRYHNLKRAIARKLARDQKSNSIKIKSNESTRKGN